VTELARRLQRVEGLLDERIVTTDMLRATEKLFEAREIAHHASTQVLEKRVEKLEAANQKLTFMLVGTFLALLVQFLVFILNLSGRAAG